MAIFTIANMDNAQRNTNSKDLKNTAQAKSNISSLSKY